MILLYHLEKRKQNPTMEFLWRNILYGIWILCRNYDI